MSHLALIMNDVVSRAIALGMAIQQRIHSPSDDVISLNQAARYLLSLGYKNPKNVLKLYAEQGKIHIHKPQGADNRKAEISVVELNGFLLEKEISKI